MFHVEQKLNLNFSPFPTLFTNRLELRQFTQADLQDYYLIRSDVELMNALDKNPNTLAEAKAVFESMEENLKNNTAITWAISFKGDKNLIGYIGFHIISQAHFRAEIGYVLLSNHHKQGLMNEAIKKIIEYGFNTMNLHTIVANTNSINIPSHKLLVSNGFKQEAHFKEDFFFNAKFTDTFIFSIINPIHKNI